MIDFVKLRINTPGLAEQLRNRPELNFESLVNTDTGEQRTTKRRAEARNLVITLHESGLVEVTGSLHKFANGGEHNHDTFTYPRLYETIQEVSALLDTPPGSLSLHNIEIGVNVVLDMPPPKLIDSLLTYRYKLPDVRRFGGKGYLKQWEQQNYIIKAYDKKKQYRLDCNTFRFEVKVLAMAYLNGTEVSTLADLLDRRKLGILGALLCETYEGLIIGEKINTEAMTGPERRTYEKGMNPAFWQELTDRRKRRYYRQRFEQIISKYGTGTRETVARLIREQVDYLLKSYDVLPDPLLANLGHFTTSYKGVNSPIPNTPANGAKTAKERRCKTCGTPIGYRRRNAVFCNKKQCRNRESNPRNNLKRRVERSRQQTALFEFREVFRPTHQQQELLVQLNLYPSAKTT